MDVCPLCHKCLEEGESLQLHYFLCPAKTGNQDKLSDQRKDLSVSVRFRWAKVVPCDDRIVHLISSLADSITLHWSDTEGLYESAPTSVPCGKYACQLAVGGEIIPIDEFDVTESSDTIYIIPIEEDDEISEKIEGESQEGIIDDNDDPVAELLASTSFPGGNDLGREAHTDIYRRQYIGVSGDNLSLEDGKTAADKSNPIELSPLYKELLQHQVLHGEPSWVLNTDAQSPTTSDQELNELISSIEAEVGPPHLTSQPANPEERHLKSPVPIRPISSHEEPSPSSQEKGTGDRRPGTRDIKGQGSRYGNRSPTASFSTYSGFSSKRSSEHSSARQSPEITSDVANESDGSNALQEQSLEEATPRDSPEIQELPQSYDGTFLTKDLPHDVPLRTATTHEERPGKSPLGTASEHSEDNPASSLGQSPPENQTTDPIPLGYTSNQSSSRASPHSKTQPKVPSTGGSVPGSRGSPVESVHSLDEAPFGSLSLDSTYTSITSLPYPGSLQGRTGSLDGDHRSPAVRSPPASSPVRSTYSSNQQRSSEDLRSPPLTGREPSARKGSSEDIRSPPLTGRMPFPPAGPAHSSTRKRSSEDLGNLRFSEQERSPPASSPTGSPHSLNYQRSPPASSPTGSPHSLNYQRRHSGEMHSHEIHSHEIHSHAGSVHSSTHSTRGPRPIVSGGSLPGQGTHPGVTSPAAISSPYSSARSVPRGSSPRPSDSRSLTESLSGMIPQGGERNAGIRSRVSPTPSHGSRQGRRSPAPVDTCFESSDSNLAFSQELLENQSPRASVHSRGSPALSHGSRDTYIKSPSTPLTDLLDNNQDYRRLFTSGPLGNQRPRSSEKPRDDYHLRYEPKQDVIVPGHFIPSSSTAFSRIYGDEGQLDVNHNQERVVLRQDPELRYHESRDRKFDFEAEIWRLRELNKDLKQQLLSVETVAALSERDNQKSLELEVVVASLEDTDRMKQQEIESLKKRCEELEEINQKLKDDQESLQTVNKLTYEDLNEANSDLRAKINDMQRKTYGSPVRTYTHADQILNKSLREKVTQLESDKRELKQKYSRIKLELDQAKREQSLSDFRLKKARSETDLSGKFDRFTSYTKPKPDKDLYDLNTTKTSSGVGSSRYSRSDSACRVGSNASREIVRLNGLLPSRDTFSSRRDERATDTPLYSTSHQRRYRSSIDDDIDLVSDTSEQNYDHGSALAHDRHRTFSSESSGSSLLEYEYGANMRVPHQQSTYSSRDARVGLSEPDTRRRPRPHSYHADKVSTSDRQTTNGDILHTRSSSHSPSRHKDYGSTSRVTDHHSSRPVDLGSHSRTRDAGSLPARYGTSSYSSSTPNSTTTGYPKVSLSPPFSPMSEVDIKLGMRVLVTRSCGSIGRGVVKYVGRLAGKEDIYVGIVLDDGDGKHDGSFRGMNYFECKPNRGIFVRMSKVIMCYPV